MSTAEIPSEARPADVYWQDRIDQSVKAPKLSTQARRRLWWQIVQVSGWALVAGLVAAGITAAVRVSAEGGGPAAASVSLPLGDVSLMTDGVLTREWVREQLGVPDGTRMLELELPALRERLESQPQVAHASLTLRFPSTLQVVLQERFPIARLRAAAAGEEPTDYLVDRDGVVFAGHGYDPDQVGRLPFLAGVKMRREKDGARFAPVDGAADVAHLLEQAMATAPHVASRWRVVSLEHAPRFMVSGDDARAVLLDLNDLTRQLARLDYLIDAARAAGTRLDSVIDLTVGPQVALAVPHDSPLRPSPPTAAGQRSTQRNHIR